MLLLVNNFNTAGDICFLFGAKQLPNFVFWETETASFVQWENFIFSLRLPGMKDVFAPWWPPVPWLLMALSALSVNTVSAGKKQLGWAGGRRRAPPLPQKNLEQKSEWRSRQQTCRGGRKYPQEAHKSRVVSRKGRGRKEGGRAGEKMSRQCPLCICWVSRRAFVMLYADPLPKAAAGLRVQLFCYSLSPLFLSLSLFCDFFVFLFFICDCRVDYYPQAADYRQSDDKIKVN